MENEEYNPIGNIIWHDIRLKSLNLSNYRGFGNLSNLEFDDKATVLIAVNGGGKTTILDAIAATLKTYVYQLTKLETAKQQEWDLLDLKNGTEIGFIETKVQVLFEFYPNPNHRPENESPINPSGIDKIDEPRILRVDINRSNLSSKIDGYEATQSTKHNFGITSQDQLKEDFKSLPILLYFGDKKTSFEEQPSGKGRMSQLYSNCMVAKRFSFRSFINWFETNYKLANLADDKNETKNQARIVELIKIVTLRILNENLNDAGEKETGIKSEERNDLAYKNLRMRYSTEGDFMTIDKRDETGKYQWIGFEQLSAGEKMLLGYTADIAMRLILANPDELHKGKNGPLEGRGIVLIDEIDLHLHPNWQQIILPSLMGIFPNIQFIVTTHSPMVLASETVYPKNVILLTEEVGTSKRITVSLADLALHNNGLEPNRILSEVMSVRNLRNQIIRSEIETISDLLTTNNFENNKVSALMAKLREKIGDSDPFIIRAKHQIGILTRQKL